MKILILIMMLFCTTYSKDFMIGYSGNMNTQLGCKGAIVYDDVGFTLSAKNGGWYSNLSDTDDIHQEISRSGFSYLNAGVMYETLNNLYVFGELGFKYQRIYNVDDNHEVQHSHSEYNINGAIGLGYRFFNSYFEIGYEDNTLLATIGLIGEFIE